MNIPISFIFNNRQYTGHLKPVQGAGAVSTWHFITDNNRYLGQLVLTNYGYQFFGNKPGMEIMAKYMGEVVSGWIESGE